MIQLLFNCRGIACPNFKKCSLYQKERKGKPIVSCGLSIIDCNACKGTLIPLASPTLHLVQSMRAYTLIVVQYTADKVVKKDYYMYKRLAY